MTRAGRLPTVDRPLPTTIIAAMLCAATVPARAAVDDYLGKPIASVRVVIEGRETTDARLASAIETRVGQPLTMRSVRESIIHLYSFGRFDDVRVEADLAETGGVALRYELSPVHPVTRIEFTGVAGVAGVDPGQLRQAVVDRFGASPPLGRAAELRQLVADALRERGYLRAEVQPSVEIRRAPDRATLLFTIDPGLRTHIGSIEIVGMPGMPRQALLDRLDLAEGAPYQREALDARIRRYLEDRRRAGYYEASLVPAAVLRDGDRTVNLTLIVMPGRRVHVAFTGDPLPPDIRAELVPVEREGSVDEDLLEDSTNRIEDYLRAQGYRDARAPHTRRESEAELVITFDVQRGPEYRVDRLVISGNASMPLSDFETALRVRDGRRFSEAALEADVAMIEDLYHRRGFVEARVRSALEPRRIEGATYVSLTVRMTIVEGPRTMVGAVHFQGNTSVSDAVLNERIGLQPGRPYVETQLVLDRDAIQLYYVNLGYLSTTVDVNPSLSGDRTRAEPVFIIHEGPRVFVEHVLVIGNRRTGTDIILRELQLKPGDPLSAAARIESQRRLATLGLFRRIQIAELQRGDETTRDLVVTVEEAPATTIGGGGGFEVRTRVVRSEENPGVASERLEFAPRGSFEIGRRNFLGKNRSINLFTSVSLHPRNSPFFAGQSGRTSDSGTFGFAEYRVLGQFREPRLFDTAADALATATIEQQIRSSFNFARRSASAEIARRVSRRIGIVANYQIQRTELFDEAIDPAQRRLIDRVFSQVRLSSVSSSVIHDTRDDVVDPRGGRYISGSVQIAARKLGSEVGFAKTFIRAQAFRPVGQTSRVVLAGNVSLGLAAGFLREVEITDAEGHVVIGEVDDLPASERFFAGGDTTVRGFTLDRVGRPDTLDSDGFPIGGNALVIFNVEVRARVRGPFSAVGFLDSGNVFRRAADIDLTQLRSSVGVGLRYRSPVGPIRVDVGFNVRPQIVAGQREDRRQLHVSLGQAF